MSDATQTHHTSLAVWGIPSTVVARERFTIRAGAKSSADCSLQGARIDACDAAGTVIGSGAMGSARWPETSALYWTELSLAAPARHGLASLSLRLDTAALRPPHRDATAAFAVMVVPPPQHTLTIRLAAQENPIADAELRLGAYRARTDASGRAELRLPKGQYDLRIWKVGYEAPARVLDIDGNMFVEIAAVFVPEENVDRAWKG
jgi:hypothetical protein